MQFNEYVRLGKRRKNYAITLFPVEYSKKGYIIKFNSREEYEDFVLHKCDRPMATAFYATNELVNTDSGKVAIKITFQKPNTTSLSNTGWVRFNFAEETDEEYIYVIYSQLVEQAVKVQEDIKLKQANTKSISLGK